MAPIRVTLHLYQLWLAGVAGYLLGCVMTADLVSRLARRRGRVVDLRAVGSGNPGAANAAANLGPRWGAAVLVGDIAKGALGAQAGRLIAGSSGAHVAAATVVLGHCYPAFSGFRGGKGVATSAGTTLITLPLYTAIDVAVAAGSFAFSRHAAKATYAASTLFVVIAWAWHRFQLPNAWGARPGPLLPLSALLTTGLIFWKFLSAPPQRPNVSEAPPPLPAVAAHEPA